MVDIIDNRTWMPASPPEFRNRSRKKKMIVPALIALLIISTGAALLFYLRLVRLVADQNQPRQNAKTEVKDLIAKVGQIIVLPESEDPTIATVTDPERLRDQPFFANARKGDKVLIYTNAKKAILYDPESNKIVEVAPINIGNPPSPKLTQLNDRH